MKKNKEYIDALSAVIKHGWYHIDSIRNESHLIKDSNSPEGIRRVKDLKSSMSTLNDFMILAHKISNSLYYWPLTDVSRDDEGGQETNKEKEETNE